MTCYNPIPACYSKSHYKKTGKKDIHLVLNEDGNKQKWLLNEKEYPHALYEYIKIPCKKCVGCRSDNAKMWSIRAQNELKMHDKNCFITLTYSNDSVRVQEEPEVLVDLCYKDFQLFMKRLRKRFPADDISYLVCGEYGLENGRAHFHAILFGFDFPDKELVYVSKGYNHYSSSILEECWTYKNSLIGFVDLANADVDCCNYVSQYVLKKLPMPDSGITLKNLGATNPDLFDVSFDKYRTPPMVRSSKNPAIGKRWFDKYGSVAVEKGFIDVPNKDKTFVRHYRTPQYYYDKFEEINPERAEELRNIKQEKMKIYYQKYQVTREELARRNESHLFRILKTIKKKLTNFLK